MGDGGLWDIGVKVKKGEGGLKDGSPWPKIGRCSNKS